MTQTNEDRGEQAAVATLEIVAEALGVSLADCPADKGVGNWLAEVIRDFRSSAAPVTAQAQPYEDSTPHLSVGNSSFESWYSDYLLNAPVHQGAKQHARNAYAAGMGDPLVRAAQQPVSGADGLPELLSLLREIRPSHGDVGTRDVDVTAQQARIDRAIELMAQPQPSGSTHPIPQTLRDAFSKIEDCSPSSSGMQVFTQMRTAVQSYFQANKAVEQPSGNATHGDEMERALSELVDKIVPGLDTGDLVADAATASKALNAQPSGNAGDLPQVVLPPRPDPVYEQGAYPFLGEVACDCYAGADVLAYGRACAEAQREADLAALAAQASGQDLVAATLLFREAFVIAVGDKSPFAKTALSKIDAAINAERAAGSE